MDLTRFSFLKKVPFVEGLNRKLRHSHVDDTATVKNGVSYSSAASVGEGTVLNEGVELRGPVTLGKYCAVAPDAALIGKDHDYECGIIQAQHYHELTGHALPRNVERVKVGNDVWIGRNAVILKGVEIGDGAVIGAGSVVTKDVEVCEIVAGNPAKHIGWRFSQDRRDQYLEAKWWNQSRKDQKKFLSSFQSKNNVLGFKEKIIRKRREDAINPTNKQIREAEGGFL